MQTSPPRPIRFRLTPAACLQGSRPTIGAFNALVARTGSKYSRRNAAFCPLWEHHIILALRTLRELDESLRLDVGHRAFRIGKLDRLTIAPLLSYGFVYSQYR